MVLVAVGSAVFDGIIFDLFDVPGLFYDDVAALSILELCFSCL